MNFLKLSLDNVSRGPKAPPFNFTRASYGLYTSSAFHV